MQSNSGEHLALFSPGVLDSSGYGPWGSGNFSGGTAMPLGSTFPDHVEIKRGPPKRKEHGVAVGFDENGDMDFSPDAGGPLNWAAALDQATELWKDHHHHPSMIDHGKGKHHAHRDKSSKPERSKQHRHDDDSSDGDRKSGRKRKRKEIETAVPWTEEMVKYLFETYDDVHRRLYIESRGKVKNQKKWEPIIKTMQEKFGREFTKNQCESKYWKVRRECTKYKLRLEKRAQHESNADAFSGKAVRELLKPKFYDVWLEVASDKSNRMPDVELADSDSEDETGDLPAGTKTHDEEVQHGEGSNQLHRHSSSCAIVRDMQQLITMRLEASEKREEALNIRAELTMELLRQHMDRMERTGSMGDDARQRQLQMIEGVDNKLDRLVTGLGTLNKNIGAIITRVTSVQQQQQQRPSQ